MASRASPSGPAACEASGRPAFRPSGTIVKARRCDIPIRLHKGSSMSKPWTIATARHTYAVPYWSDGYADIDEAGDVVMRPRGAGGPALSLPAIVERACAEGLRLPLLLRFPDILADRLARLQGAFARAIAEHGYAGAYTAIYPIKVNQQRGVAGELVAAGHEGFGLEAGSKPELMAVLAMARPGSIVICNGYKDREYIRLALVGRKLGLRVHIVIEKLSQDMTASLKAGNQARLSTLRMMRSQVLLEKKKDAAKQTLSDAEVAAVLGSYAKKLKESAAEYEKLGK